MFANFKIRSLMSSVVRHSLKPKGIQNISLLKRKGSSLPILKNGDSTFDSFMYLTLFFVPAERVEFEQGTMKWAPYVCVDVWLCVCVCVCVWLTLLTLCFGMLYTHALMDFNETWVQ